MLVNHSPLILYLLQSRFFHVNQHTDDDWGPCQPKIEMFAVERIKDVDLPGMVEFGLNSAGNIANCAGCIPASAGFLLCVVS